MAQTKARFTGPPAFPTRATASRKQRFLTNHETRNTAFFESRPLRPFGSPWCTTGGATRNRRPDHCPRRQAAVFLFTIVHHCSLLFAIVQQKNCSAPLSSRRPVAAFLRVVARHGAAMARHGRRPSPAPAARPVRFSPATRHATWFFPVLRRLQGEQPQARLTGFSRITRHESQLLRFPTQDFPRFPGISRPPTPRERVRAPFSRCFPARCGAASGGYGAAWVAAAPPRRQQGLLGFHQPRDTQHGFSLFLRRLQGEQPQARPTGFSRVTNHESRVTAFMLFFPLLPGISRYSSDTPLPRSRCPLSVSRRSRHPPGCFRRV